MIYDIKDIDYDTLRNQGTGGHLDQENNRIIEYPFGKYLVKVLVTSSNEFIGIVELQINKDFRSYKQKISNVGFHDVDEFYQED
jgi:hypothetical protein